MKKMLIATLAVLSFGAVYAYSEVNTVLQPVRSVSSPGEVWVSTHQYVNVSSASLRMRNMSGLLINNPQSNTDVFHGHLGGCSSTGISTSTVRGPFQFAPAANTAFISIGEDVCLWLVSEGVSPSSVTVQGVRQKP